MDNSRFYKIGAGIGIGLVVLIAIFMIVAKNRDKQISKTEEAPSSVMSSTNLVEDEALTIDIKEADFKTIEEASNKDKSEKKVNSSSNKSTEKNDATTEQNKKEVKQEEVKKDPTFIFPVKGEITQDYAKDKLVYSATLGEWITHTGIDIRANKTTVVVASADGKVKAIKNDPRYGLTVVIEHSNGFSTVYSNLLTAEFVSVGENVKSGQTIGTVGNTAAFEILDEPHLHFEILKDSEPIDPNMYVKN